MTDKGLESISGMASSAAARVGGLESRVNAPARFEYEYFLFHAAPYQAEPLRLELKDWFNKLGKGGWVVFSVTPQKDNPAGYIAWAWREVR